MLRSIWKTLDSPGAWRRVQAVAGYFTVRAYRRQVADLLRLSGKETILDVGCGTGDYSQLLDFRTYVGVDYNEQYIQWACQAYGADGRVSFFKMDVADVPRLDLRLDSAFCVGVTHHLSDEELKKMATDVLASIAVRFVIVDLVLPPLWRNPLSHVLIRMDRGRHGRTRQGLLDVLKQAGFSVESVAVTFGFPHSVVGISLRHESGP